MSSLANQTRVLICLPCVGGVCDTVFSAQRDRVGSVRVSCGRYHVLYHSSESYVIESVHKHLCTLFAAHSGELRAGHYSSFSPD